MKVTWDPYVDAPQPDKRMPYSEDFGVPYPLPPSPAPAGPAKLSQHACSSAPRLPTMWRSLLLSPEEAAANQRMLVGKRCPTNTLPSTQEARGPSGQQKWVPRADHMVPPYSEGAESISGLGLPQFHPLRGFLG